jgi:hypothetical protein
MKIDAFTYRLAASERVTLARELYESEQHVMATYMAGVSVECTLRSFLAGTEFAAAHDLPVLLKASKLLQRLPEGHAEDVATHLTFLWTRWHNLMRYFSEPSMRRFIVQRRLHIGIKGDPLKETARTAVNSALTIVARGEATWTR